MHLILAFHNFANTPKSVLHRSLPAFEFYEGEIILYWVNMVVARLEK